MNYPQQSEVRKEPESSTTSPKSGVKREILSKKTIAVVVLLLVALLLRVVLFNSQKNPTEELMSMVNSASVEEVVRSIREGANVNAVDENGWTPLMFAADSNSNPEILRILIENGADISIKNSEDKNAFDYADENEELKGTDVYHLLWEKTLSKTN